MKTDILPHRFTLTIIPDTGHETKTGHLSSRVLTWAFIGLASLFILCCTVIAGYHIKLIQEYGYRTETKAYRQHMERVAELEGWVVGIADRLDAVQTMDRAFRAYAALPLPDDGMYQAGIGGHMIVDQSRFTGLPDGIAKRLADLAMLLTTLDRRVFVERNSFDVIREDLREQLVIINNTPTILPALSLNITSRYGYRVNPVTHAREFHDAVDFAGHRGDKIFASADGVVEFAGWHSLRGNYVVIRHQYGFKTLYAHLDKILVTEGQTVRKCDQIGTMGSTGRATGPNLHYSISLNGRTVNPIDYF